MNGNVLLLGRVSRRDILKYAAAGLFAAESAGLWVWRTEVEKATVAPLSDVKRETLFQFDLPKTTFPLEAYYTGILTCALAPGFDGTLYITDQIVQTIIVLEGEFTFDQCGSAQVFRSSGEIEACGAEGTIVLGSGDVRVITDFSRSQHILNLGSVRSKMLYSPIGYRDPYWSTAGDITNYIAINTLYDHDWIEHGLSGRSLHLSYDRFVLNPGAATIINRDRYPVVRLAETGLVESVVTRVDGTDSEPELFWGGAFPMLMSERIDHSTWTNVSDHPMEIFEYSLQPDDSDLTTPAA